MIKNVDERQGHSSKAIKATYWSAVNTIVPLLTAFGVFVVTSRTLTPTDFGIVALATGLALVGTALCPGGFGEALIQRLEVSADHLDTVFWLCVCSGCAVFLLECLLARSAASFFHMAVLVTLIPVIGSKLVADMAAVVPNALIARSLDFHLFAVRTVFVSVIAAAVAIGLLLAGYGIWSLVASQVLTSYVTMFAAFLASKWRPGRRFSHAALREMAGYGLYSAGTQNIGQLFTQNEQILVGFFLGTAPLGFYNFSKRVIAVFNGVVAGSLGAVAHPAFSGIQNDPERVRRGFLSATYVSSLLSFPVFLGLACVSDRIVPLFFGQSWRSAVPLVQVQCSLGLLGCIGAIQSGLITSQGKANWWFYYQLFAMLTTALLIATTARYGLFVMVSGIAIKTYLLWFIPVGCSVSLLSMRVVDYLVNFRTPMVGTIGMAVAIFAERRASGALTPIEGLFSDIAVGLVSYLALIFLMDRKRIGALFSRLLPRKSRTA
jgi:O-antigen/teichoic acid export membrane protein